MQPLHNPDQTAQWLRTHVRGTLRTDSRAIAKGDGFVAWPGAATDGRAWVRSALASGAAACLVEQDGLAEFDLASVSNSAPGAAVLASYPGLKQATGAIAAAYFDHPSHALDLVAVTGTNGKTSTAWWLTLALSALQNDYAKPAGMVGTLGVGRPPHALVTTGMTTPDPVLLQHTLRRFVDEGLQACVMEASSIGIEEGRLNGCQLRVAIFTNFTQDHLDYHGSMATYWQAKRRLFAWPGLRSAVINVDDAQGAALAQELTDQAGGDRAGTAPGGQAPQTPDVWTVSIQGPARLMGCNIRYLDAGLAFEVVEGTERHPLQTRLVGDYNLSNLLGVLAAMRALGVPLAEAIAACANLQAVPGRMECVSAPHAPLVAVDYAHTPDALQHALKALRPMATARGGKLWCVFGCGGDRDNAKRPLMGAEAAQHADHVVVTSDNPRSEQADSIIAQIMQGLPSDAELVAAVVVQPDRAKAIAQTIGQAAAADVVLLAGKGHEETQDIGGVKTPFSDRLHAEAALNARASGTPVQGVQR